MWILRGLLSLFLVIVPLKGHTGFEGYKVYTLSVETQKQLDFLNEVDAQQPHFSTDEIQFWDELPQTLQANRDIVVMLSPEQQRQFLTALDAELINHEETITDLAAALKEQTRMSDDDRKVVENGGMTWNAYHDYHTIEAYILNLVDKYPSLVKNEGVYGLSYEGRNLRLIKVGVPHPEGKTKPAIWLEANIHAREWLAVATMTYIVNKLVTEYPANPKVKRMMEEIDWYIVPVVNVDGYVHTHLNPGNADFRLWRTTRAVNPFSPIPGGDPNRNYDHKWMHLGADQNSGSQTFAGPYPYSDVENLFLTEAVIARQKEIKCHISFHCCAQLWLTPWAYDREFPGDYKEIHDLGVEAMEALTAVNGIPYGVGTPPVVLYAGAGGTLDWIKGKVGIKYAYAPELRRSQFAFLNPPSDIIPSGEETFEAMYVTAKQIYLEYGPTVD